ncbi:MAG: hypothetical protein Fur0032_04740 [Terrimicrobiaceae bacterium]
MNPADAMLVVKSGSNYQAVYDAGKMELRVRPEGGFTGLIDVPMWLEGFGGKKLAEGILTLAVMPASGESLDPVVFVESQSKDTMTFRVTALCEGRVGSVSCVAQSSDGTTHLLRPVQADGERWAVPLKGLDASDWIRLTVATEDGRVARPARAPVGDATAFRWQDGIIYYAFTDRFDNGEAANDKPVEHPGVLPAANYLGGDFQGISRRIQEGYFRRLGVNILWLAPLNRNPEGAWQEYLPPYRWYTGYHGYWPVSHTEVEPRFGGAEGLQELVSSAHKNNIRIIADLVLKHTHVDHPFWQEKKDWYGELALPDGRKNLRLWDEEQFTTWFEEWLPGFDFEDPEPVAFLIDNAGYWVETFGLDGFRLDAVKHIQPSFWWKFRTAMREKEAREGRGPMYFVGETFMDRQGIMQFVGPNMLDGQFDFPLYDTMIEVLAKGTLGFNELEKSLLASEIIYGKETLMSPLVGNHDKPRFMAYADGDLPDPEISDEEEVGWNKPPQVDKPAAYRKLALALAFVLSIDGVPMIYYGDEVGLTGAGDPDNRRMMPRDNQLTTDQIGVRTFFEKAAAARNTSPALRYGSRRALLVEGHRYAFVRRYFDDCVLAVWNSGEQSSSFDLSVAPELPDGSYRDALGGAGITVHDGIARFELPPMTVAFFVPEKP